MTTGMRKFFILWFGQLVSLSGTSMTRFALLIWAYQQTGKVTTLALLGFASYILYLVFSPIAGVLVDRWDRRIVLLAADLCSGLTTASILVLYLRGDLQIWHLYIAEALTGAFDAFQMPAYYAATTVLVPKEHYSRASGMRSLAQTVSQVIAPPLAGLVLVGFHLPGVLIIDLATFGIALITLSLVRIPRPIRSQEGKQVDQVSLLSQMAFGFRYIFARTGLLYLMIFYAGINFIAALTYYGVLNAMILARTGGNELALASVQSALGIGGVLGGIIISVWGGPKRKIHGILAFGAISFLLGDFMMGVGRGVLVWTGAALFSAFFIPFIISADRAIWQQKVPADIQGRIFGVQGLFRQMGMPLGYLLAGPLADRILEPAMMPGGTLAPIFGGLVGTGPGAGMGLMFVCTALMGCALCLSGYLIPAVRNVERDLPDAEVDSAVSDEEQIVS